MSYETLKRILFGCLIAYLPLSFLFPVVMYRYRDNNRLIVMDNSDSYIVSRYASDEQLRRMYVYQVKQACLAFLQRNPDGFDFKEMLDDMFVGEARKFVQKHWESEREQFRQFKIHQKVEVMDISISRTDPRHAFATVGGELLRFYIENGKRVFAVDFTMSIELMVNYDCTINARYPFVVKSISYKQKIHEEGEVNK